MVIYYKIVLVGNSGVGKTAFLLKLSKNLFSSNYNSTIGIDFEKIPVNFDDKDIILQVWDTAGQEKFSSLTSAYYRGANLVFLFYDITDINSFNSLDTWQNKVQSHNNNTEIVLIGTKLDLEDMRVVSKARASKYAKSKGMRYYEISSKEWENKKIFRVLVEKVLDKLIKYDENFNKVKRPHTEIVSYTPKTCCSNF